MSIALLIQDPEILSGTPVFAGTRVPAATLTDYLAAGDTIDVFLEDFPSVSREQVLRFLREAQAKVIEAVG